MAYPTWHENKQETRIIINGEDWFPESLLKTSHNSDYAAAQRVIEEYLKTEQDLNFHKFGDFVSLRLNA